MIPDKHKLSTTSHQRHENGRFRCLSRLVDQNTLKMRVWERGTGITLACGSGACATAVAAQLRGLSDTSVRMELDGGWLELEITDDGVWMAGPTAYVFDGTLTPEFLEGVI